MTRTGSRKFPDQLYCGGTLNLEMMTPVGNDGGSEKPNGGLWTSTYNPKNPHTPSDWVRWCVSQDFGITAYCNIIEIKPSARIYTIDKYDDLKKLGERFPHPVTRRRVGGGVRRFVNWVKISKVYDAVHLTHRGVGATLSGWGDERELSFGGWDVESTVWFRDVFESVVPLKLDIKMLHKLCREQNQYGIH